MHTSLLIALGAGKAAMAMVSNYTYAAANTTAANMPSYVGDFKLYACAADRNDFTDFKTVAESKHMSLNLCAASCPSQYFATHDHKCLCGHAVPEHITVCEPRQCSLRCPGNNRESCGGSNGDSGRLCTIYVRNSPPRLETKTHVNVHTVTACPSTVVDCPARHTPQVVTQTKTIVTEVCLAPEWHKKKIVCYGGNCAPEYPCQGENCRHHRVICQGDACWTEVSKHREDWSRLVVCDAGCDECNYAKGCQGDECNKKIVCYDGKCAKEHCLGDECRQNLVCHGEECRHAKCDGEGCHQRMTCHDGQDCTIVTPCLEKHCSKPSMPTELPVPVATPAPMMVGTTGPMTTVTFVGNNGGSNGGNNGGNGGDMIMPGVTASNAIWPGPTALAPMIGAGERNAVTLIGALAGLAFFLLTIKI